MSVITENWQIRKPAVSSDKGLVATQHYMASDIGAEVLRQGGNAIDAALAAGLALGTVEPWMTGIGGGGYMTIYLAASKEVKVVEFGMRAPFNSKTEDYPLAGEGENASDAFNWPRVVGDTNIHGPLSVAVPGYIRGIAKALAEFGTWNWKDVACKGSSWGDKLSLYIAKRSRNHGKALW